MPGFFNPTELLVEARYNLVMAKEIPENTLDPGDDFVGGWVTGLVEVDDTGLEVGLYVPL